MATEKKAAEDPDAIETVLATARLARLQLARGRAVELAPRFARILEAFGSLAAREPDRAPQAPAPLAPRDVTREDVPRAGLSREAFLAAAAERADGHLRVPRAVGRDA